MTTNMLLSKALLAAWMAIAAAAPLHVGAQTASTPTENSLVGSWLVTVKSEPVTRTFVVSEEAATATGALLKAAYGLSTRGQGPVAAEMRRVDSRRQLHFVTQADTKVVVTEQADGSFVGTFTVKSGKVMEVTLARFTDEIKLRIAQAKAVAGTQKPGAEVPANCAAFSGGWGGEWPVQGYVYLWVMSVDASCAAKVAYNRNATPPTSAQGLLAATIKDHTLLLPRPDGGTTSFELSGGVLNARYAGPAGTNAATMQRVDAAAAARIDAEQKAVLAVVPPSADLPAACAAYFGQWRGRWNTDGTNDMYLRVAEIKAAGDKCTVRYSFTSATSPVPARSVAEIKNDAISFVCNQNTGGTCIFSFRGNDTIDASYSNSMGGRNSGTFNRIK